jgi:hypothetical protein
VLKALRPVDGGDGGKELDGIRLVSVPGGLSDGDDRRGLGKFIEAFTRSVPGYVEQLIRETKVKWLVGDVNMGMCFEVARKLGVRVAAVFPASAACLWTLFQVPRLIEDGFLYENGTVASSDLIHRSLFY